MSRRFLPCCLAALFFVSAARAQVSEVPFLTGRITDNAEILSEEIRGHLTAIIRAHEEQSGDQIAILTEPSLGGTVEDFSARVLEAWKLGDHGVLLVVSPEDRRIRIEAGSALKGKISEQAAARIVRDIMAPPFRERDYNRGIDAGVHAIIGLLEADAGGTPAPAAHTASGDGESPKDFFEGPDLPIHVRILLGAFIFGIIGLFTAVALVTPGAGWFLYFFLIPFWAMFPVVVLGSYGAFFVFVVYIAGFPIAKIRLTRSGWLEKKKAIWTSS